MCSTSQFKCPPWMTKACMLHTGGEKIKRTFSHRSLWGGEKKGQSSHLSSDSRVR